MDGLGKGLAIAACGIGICTVAILLKEPIALWAFVPVAWMAQDWKIKR